MIVEVRDAITDVVVSSQNIWVYVWEDLFVGTEFKYNGKIKVFCDGVEIKKPTYMENLE